MPKHALPPLDLHAPDAIDALIAFHRSLVGDARMEVDGDAGTGDGANNDAGAGGDTGKGDADKGAADADKGAADADKAVEKVEDLPEWAQKIIRDTRGEAASNRTKATAAEQKQAQTLDAIAKALGLKSDEQPDPEKLTAELTTAQAAQKQAAVELAIYKTASKHSGDPAALLDSRAFLAKLADLDPTAEDFTTNVDDAIKQAIADNPKLKVAQVAGRSGAESPGGSGGQRKTPTTLAGAISEHYGA